MKERIDPIEAILDANNHDNIVLYDENDKAMEFAQIALIPWKERIFVILKPITSIEGIADDEALTFEICEEKGNAELVVIDDADIVKRVFEKYYKLVDEADAS